MFNLVVSASGKHRLKYKPCIPIHEDCWEECLADYPQAIVYMENVHLIAQAKMLFPAQVILRMPSRLEEEIQEYFPGEIASIILAYTKEEKIPAPILRIEPLSIPTWEPTFPPCPGTPTFPFYPDILRSPRSPHPGFIPKSPRSPYPDIPGFIPDPPYLRRYLI